jgi:5-methylcytosine-specific restriction protein A
MKPCARPGCAVLLPLGVSYCSKHQAEADEVRRKRNARADGRRRARSDNAWRGWYKLAKWAKLRKAVLDDQPHCVMCLERGRFVLANVVDHIRPHRGDWSLFFDRTNLQSLCETCHNSTKQAEERAAERLGEDRGAGQSGKAGGEGTGVLAHFFVRVGNQRGVSDG